MARVVVFNYLFISKMFEQENLQGWNISHIVSSWHRGLGKENSAITASLASECEHRVGNPGKAQGEQQRAGGREDLSGGQSLSSQGE